MTEPSEAEVEAAAKALWNVDLDNEPWETAPAHWKTSERKNARAALTAAAQVREPGHSAQEFQAVQDRCEEFRDALEQIAVGRGITVAKIAEKAVSIARQVLMQDATPTTEPDSGPDVLGERKDRE